jgi:hypothetical protein
MNPDALKPGAEVLFCQGKNPVISRKVIIREGMKTAVGVQAIAIQSQ